jgi:hypothetical protein
MEILIDLSPGISIQDGADPFIARASFLHLIDDLNYLLVHGLLV